MIRLLLLIFISFQSYAQIETNSGTSGGARSDKSVSKQCLDSIKVLKTSKKEFSKKYSDQTSFKQALDAFVFTKTLENISEGKTTLPPYKKNCDCEDDPIIKELKDILMLYFYASQQCSGKPDEDFYHLKRVLEEYER